MATKEVFFTARRDGDARPNFFRINGGMRDEWGKFERELKGEYKICN
ncbi:protein of unknown function [Clostridium beijerinckii]|nr:protein of unknown function [Clostridium beijerinckii]